MEQQVRVLAILLIVFGVLGLLGGILAFSFIAFAGVASGDEEALVAMPIIGIFVAMLVFVTALPGIIAGWGLLKHQSWARILGIIVCIISLPGFPIGTALGVYGLYVLFHEQTKPLFEGRVYVPPSEQPPVPPPHRPPE